MPKLKTNRSAAKRFRLTGTGKIKRSHAFARHLLSKKAPKRKRTLRHSALVAEVDSKNIKRMIGF